tara:strand:- start:85 stop:519 length:435 start_codon:yes stop_codon:yes gene_type:complete
MKFGVKRTVKQAFVFYLAYLLLISLVGIILAVIINQFLPTNCVDFKTCFEEGYEQSSPIVNSFGLILSIIAPLLLSFLILKEKKLLSNFKYILLALLSGIMGIFGFAPGLILVAYLTTRKSAKMEMDNKDITTQQKKDNKKINN